MQSISHCGVNFEGITAFQLAYAGVSFEGIAAWREQASTCASQKQVCRELDNGHHPLPLSRSLHRVTKSDKAQSTSRQLSVSSVTEMLTISLYSLPTTKNEVYLPFRPRMCRKTPA